MTIQRMIELLEIEHECILRNSHDDCDRNCADCNLVQDDGDLHEMYTDVIALLKKQEPKTVIINPEKYGDWLKHCPSCETVLPISSQYKRAKFCHLCGQAVK